MKRSPIPAANALARADGLGLRRHAIEKKSPRKGTKTCKIYITVCTAIIEKKSPRKGTKTPFVPVNHHSTLLLKKSPQERGRKQAIMATMEKSSGY